MPLWLLLPVLVLFACKKAGPEPAPVSQPDLTKPFRAEADFPIGVAISYASMITDARYQEIVKRDFDAVTIRYNTGYRVADALDTRLTGNGLITGRRLPCCTIRDTNRDNRCLVMNKSGKVGKVLAFLPGGKT